MLVLVQEPQLSFLRSRRPYDDDLADSMTQAILRFRQGGFIITPTDYFDRDGSITKCQIEKQK